MIVTVTENDIREGHKGDCFRCPIANAVRRALMFRRLDSVRVEAGEIEITGRVRQLPWVAMSFVERFDAGDEVEAFSFELATQPNLAGATS